MTEHRVRVRATLFFIQYDHEDGQTSLIANIKFSGDYEKEAKVAEETAARSIDIPNWNPALFAISFIPQKLSANELQAA
jgi:hypothetical protein